MSLHTFITRNPPNFSEIYFGNAVPTSPDGNYYNVGDLIVYVNVPFNTAAPPGTPVQWLCTAPGVGGTATWIPQGAGGDVLLTGENGANNAIALPAGSGPTLYIGLSIRVLLAHSLQAGANTIAYNAGVAASILSSRNTANNIGTAYVSGGIITLVWNGTAWLDTSQ